MKPRLLFISRKWPPAVGGMETYSASLAASLSLHFDVHRVVLSGQQDGRPPGLFTYAWFIFRTSLYCLFVARRFPYVIFGDILLLPAAIACRLANPKQSRATVVYGLDLVYHERLGLLPRFYRYFFSMIVLFQSCLGTFVAISGYTAQLAKKAGLKQVTVITPPVPQTPLTSSNNDHDEAKRCGSFSQEKIIFHYGRLVERKGAVWFAASVLPRLPPNVRFVVAGPATDRTQVERLSRCEHTTYKGVLPPDSIAAWIRTADLVVMPNISNEQHRIDVEGFGLVAIETTALGGILAAAKFQGITDAVVDGVTGTLVESGDIDAWVSIITGILEEDVTTKDKRRSAARKKTRELFSIERMGNAYASLMNART